jgi:hypothetical protein
VTFRTDVPHGPSPKDVDREDFAVFSAMNENQSPLLSASLHRFAKRRPYPRDRNNDEFTESNLMHSINGYVFGNEPMIADVGEIQATARPLISSALTSQTPL